jgi:predicted CoA-binding protein
MRTVAVIGAHNDRSRFGNKAVRAFLRQGFQVFSINPNETTIEGLQAYKTITDIPIRPEMVTVYVRPEILINLLPEIARKGCDELWLNPGTTSDEVLKVASELNLNVIQACSILGIGVSPAAL